MVAASQHLSRQRPSTVAWRQTSRQRYVRRRPEQSTLYSIISKHLESWLAEHDAHGQPISRHVEAEFRRYLACGLLCFGFARARCGRCGQGFLVAFSCKARGVCPSCTGRRMVQTAAHLADHVIPPVPVRQWVISVPKRLRGVLADRPQAMTTLSRIFLDEIERLVCDVADVPVGSGIAGQARPRLGAVSFQHRFGSALNRHVHLHACVTDGVFERVAAAGDVRFHAARPLSPADLATVTQRVRRRFVRWFCRKGFLSHEAATDMLAWQHSGFSVDASVRISPSDRDVPAYFQRLEHLLRYCARPAFALERLSVVPGAGDRPERVCYALPRHKRGDWVGPGRARKSTRPGTSGVVDLSPFEFLDRLAALIPPPRKHRHRYHGVFAPNHPLRPAVNAMAIGNLGNQGDAADRTDSIDEKRCDHDTSRIAWAKLLARVGEAFPLACPNCGGDIGLISFITQPETIRKILTHLGEPLVPPPVSPARGPPVDWDDLVQAEDDRSLHQAFFEDLPMIDIHRR